MWFLTGNKQRQRERQLENFQVPSQGGKRRESSSTRPTPINQKQSQVQPLPALNPTPQPPPIRQVEITTTNINDLFSSSAGPPTVSASLIVPENARQHRASQQQQATHHSPNHVPVKVHVAHKPTVEDTTRVYNPYPFRVRFIKKLDKIRVVTKKKPKIYILISLKMIPIY